jgi:hypothetical protein
MRDCFKSTHYAMSLTEFNLRACSLRNKYPPHNIEFDLNGEKIRMVSFKEQGISIRQAWVLFDTAQWQSEVNDSRRLIRQNRFV